ncbi:MAG: hypothetical protein AB8B53_12355 [Flavobacteriales bacterium]
MKHLKFLTACFALFLTISITAQTSETDSAQEERVTAAAEKYTAEMVEALGLTEQARIKTIQMLNHNYELAVDKTNQKGSSEEDLKKVLSLIDESRNKRFQGVLTPEQYTQYRNWKRTSNK